MLNFLNNSMPLVETEERQEILTEAQLAAKHEAMSNPDLYGGDMLGAADIVSYKNTNTN